MVKHKRAGQLAQQSDLINVDKLTYQYYVLKPEIGNFQHAVKFGTSGHRGSAIRYNFNEQHILAIAQAIAEERLKNGITGPCFIGKDTHALSEPAFISMLEVLTANGIDIICQNNNGLTPTPAISNAILIYNIQNCAQADGIIITSSHNPPEYGGIKYNFSTGGPANIKITKNVENRANKLIANRLKDINRISINAAIASGRILEKDLVKPFVEGLIDIINIAAIKKSGLKLAVDPLGGSGIEYWKRIVEYYKLDLVILNDKVDPTFRFMHLDKDGIIRIDCSSEFSMSGLLTISNKFDLTFANDPDHDRYGIIISTGLMKSNNYLAVAINYLLQNRPFWNKNFAIGKSIVSSVIIDNVVKYLGRKLIEMPVGFKWFVNGLYNGSFCFVCEESAGASFLRFNGTPWSTDKDGIIMCLLAAEIIAVTGKNLQEHYKELTDKFGFISYNKLQITANLAQKKVLSHFSPKMINRKTLANFFIKKIITFAPGNGAPINGIKVITDNGWFAVRPSGTEDKCNIYCESLLNEKHRFLIEKEAIEIISNIFKILH